MTISLGAVDGVSPTTGPSALGALTSRQVDSPDSDAFLASMTGALQDVQDRQQLSGELAIQAVTGQLDDIHDYTIAATEAQVTLEVTAAIRNRLVDAFTEIMRMQA